jgi:hypothetical protein
LYSSSGLVCPFHVMYSKPFLPNFNAPRSDMRAAGQPQKSPPAANAPPATSTPPTSAFGGLPSFALQKTQPPPTAAHPVTKPVPVCAPANRSPFMGLSCHRQGRVHLQLLLLCPLFQQRPPPCTPVQLLLCTPAPPGHDATIAHVRRSSEASVSNGKCRSIPPWSATADHGERETVTQMQRQETE